MLATELPPGAALNPEEERVLRRLADGSWRPTRRLGGSPALPRLHRLARRGALDARFNPTRHGFEWRRPDLDVDPR